jgi:hypothetical protein
VLNLIRVILRLLLLNRPRLVTENVALRQQLALVRRNGKPETVVKWHRRGFKLYWRWQSRKRGRAKVAPEVSLCPAGGLPQWRPWPD